MSNEKKLALYECIKHENYLQELTEKISIFCDNPVLTMDYMHQVRSFHGKATENSHTWNDMIETGTLNPKWIHDFFHSTMKELIEKLNPYVFPMKMKQ